MAEEFETVQNTQNDNEETTQYNSSIKENTVYSRMGKVSSKRVHYEKEPKFKFHTIKTNNFTLSIEDVTADYFSEETMAKYNINPKMIQDFKNKKLRGEKSGYNRVPRNKKVSTQA